LCAPTACPTQPAAPPTPAPEATPPGDQIADDATTVIAILYDRGTTPPLNQDLATALNLDLDRLRAAHDEAQLCLAAAGLRIARSHGEVSICPTHDHSAVRTALAQVQAHTQGLKLDAYQAAYQMMTGQPPLPDRTVARRRFLLGHLANLGVADLADRTPSLTDAAHTAFPLAPAPSTPSR
jgi:hypothetical protein